MKKYEVYATLFVLSILFTIIDIVVSSCQLAIPSLIFSTITMVIGFVGAYKSKTLELEEKYTDTIKFINKNFNKANIILNVLDVFCCVLAFVTGVFAMLLIVRCTIAIRIAIYINKYRSVAFGLWGLAFMHIFKKIKGERVMTKNTILQKVLATIIAVFGVGGVVVFFMPQFMVIAEEVTKYVSMASEIIAVVSGIWLAGTHDKVLSADEINAQESKVAEKKALKLAKKEYKVKQEQEIKALAEQKVKEEAEKKIQVAKEVE